MGREPSGTMGLGTDSEYSRSRIPSPPQKITTFKRLPPAWSETDLASVQPLRRRVGHDRDSPQALIRRFTSLSTSSRCLQSESFAEMMVTGSGHFKASRGSKGERPPSLAGA